MTKGKIVGIVAGSLAFLFLVSGCCFFFGMLSGSMPQIQRPANIYEIRIEGLITAAQAGILGPAGTNPETVISQLDAAEQDPNIRAILLRINSPGGSPAASQEIFEELRKVEKPVVVSVSEACTSGAYYIACAADSIVANRSSAIGGIGVIVQVINLEGLYDKLGIEYTTITQGEYKDIGSPARPMREDEARLLEEQTQKLYDQFIEDVAEARQLDLEQVQNLATGWMYLGTEALQEGMIDEVGTYKDAIDIAAELGGVEQPRVTARREISLIDIIFSYYFADIYNRIFGEMPGMHYLYR